MPQIKVRQNSHYTFKYNTAFGRHGWLRLTPAYSVRLVEEILANLDYTPQCVLEPFSGTGTTELVCANKGIPSVAMDINPFLVWLGNAKLQNYSPIVIETFLQTANAIAQDLENSSSSEFPHIYNIQRWWDNTQLKFLAKLKFEILRVRESAVQNLLLIAFCRAIIDFSKASFNHVSTSFKEEDDNSFDFHFGKECFLSICAMIALGAKQSPQAAASVILYDSKNIPAKYDGLFDTVITSPPYPNRISYIRELRPYMYWLDYLQTSEQASELDWETIGGTWGKATSLLSTWDSKNSLPQYVYDIAYTISVVENKSAGLMANYVLKYFEDMNEHLSVIYKGLRPGGKIFYIIGNSNFYGTTVPAERIYSDMMQRIGFTNISHSVVRKRNCNKHLFEYIVTGEKNS